MIGNKIRVLIVDNDAEVVDSVGAIVEQVARERGQKPQYIKHYTGSGAVKAFAEHDLDLAFVDYYFGDGVSGAEALAAADDPFGRTLIVLMSGRGEEELRGVLSRQGVALGERFRFLRKPIDVAQIRACILAMEQYQAQMPYPAPLAYPMALVANPETGMARLTSIINCCEAVLRHATAVTMADLARFKALDRLTVPIDLSRKLSLGAWRQWARAGAKACERVGAKGFSSDMVGLLLSADTELFFTKLQQLRDQHVNHASTRDDGWYQDEAAKIEPDFRKIWHDLREVSMYPMVACEAVSNVSAERILYRFRVLMGTSAVFELAAAQVATRLNLNEVYLLNRARDALSLHPFFVYERCPTCEIKRVYWLDSPDKKSGEYVAYCNHRLRLHSGGMNEEMFRAILWK